MKTKSTGQLLLIASRILKSMYDSKVASLRDCIDAEENFLAAEYNHVGSRFHETDIMVHRAYDYIENGVGRKTRITPKLLRLSHNLVKAYDDWYNYLKGVKFTDKDSKNIQERMDRNYTEILKEVNILYPEFKAVDEDSVYHMAEGITIGYEPKPTHKK
jgi:hypothetical protein